MPNSNYIAGRAKEYQIMRTLESVGYVCTRSSGSHGPWDVVAVNGTEVKLVQSKFGSGITKDERREFESLPVPKNVIKEIWEFTRGVKEAKITCLKPKNNP